MFIYNIALNVEAISVSVKKSVAIKALYGFEDAGRRKEPTPAIVTIVRELKRKV